MVYFVITQTSNLPVTWLICEPSLFIIFSIKSPRNGKFVGHGKWQSIWRKTGCLITQILNVSHRVLHKTEGESYIKWPNPYAKTNCLKLKQAAFKSHHRHLVSSPIQNVLGCMHECTHVLHKSSTDLLKLIKRDMHETPCAQHLEQLSTEISGYCLDQSQRPLYRVLRATDLTQMSKDGI